MTNREPQDESSIHGFSLFGNGGPILDGLGDVVYGHKSLPEEITDFRIDSVQLMCPQTPNAGEAMSFSIQVTDVKFADKIQERHEKRKRGNELERQRVGELLEYPADIEDFLYRQFRKEEMCLCRGAGKTAEPLFLSIARYHLVEMAGSSKILPLAVFGEACRKARERNVFASVVLSSITYDLRDGEPYSAYGVSDGLKSLYRYHLAKERMWRRIRRDGLCSEDSRKRSGCLKKSSR